MTLSTFTGSLGSPEHDAWKAQCLALNKRYSRRFAAYQAKIGRPVPRSAEDRRPDPGCIDNEAGEIVEG